MSNHNMEQSEYGTLKGKLFGVQVKGQDLRQEVEELKSQLLAQRELYEDSRCSSDSSGLLGGSLGNFLISLYTYS